MPTKFSGWFLSGECHRGWRKETLLRALRLPRRTVPCFAGPRPATPGLFEQLHFEAAEFRSPVAEALSKTGNFTNSTTSSRLSSDGKYCAVTSTLQFENRGRVRIVRAPLICTGLSISVE